jgi:hypothetical protein
VPVSGHRVGNHGRKQALDRREQRHRQCCRQQRQNQISTKGRQMNRRQAAGDRPELRADGLNRQPEGDY